MVAQQKYELVADAVIEAYEVDGLRLALSEGVLWVYEGGSWTQATPQHQDDLDRAALIQSKRFDFPYAEKYSYLMRQIRTRVAQVPADAWDARPMIAMRNGTLDVLTGELVPSDPSHCTTRRVDVEYDADAKCPEWMAMLDRMLEDKDEKTRAEYVHFLKCYYGVAIAGYRAISGRATRKLLFLVGPHHTGKSSVADVLKYLFGSDRVATESVSEIGERFGLQNLLRAQAWIADDATDDVDRFMSSARLKKLITGEALTADVKGKRAQSFVFNGPCLVNGNALPNVSDPNGALGVRCVALTFSRQFGPEDQARLGGKKVYEYLAEANEYPGILNWALEGLAEVMETKKLPQVEDALSIGEQWRMQNEPVYAFIRSCTEVDPVVQNSCMVLKGAASMFAEVEFQIKFSPSRASKHLFASVDQVHGAAVKKERTRVRGDGQTWVMRGLRLTEQGVEFAKMAREKGLLTGPSQYNAPVL